MPRKTKKSAEADAAEPMPAAASPKSAELAAPQPQLLIEAVDASESKPAAKRKAAAKKAPAKKKAPKRAAEPTAEAALELEESHRKRIEVPATPDAGQVEAAAQAADAFEEAIESNAASEVEALGIDLQPTATTADDEDEAPEHFEAAPRPPEKLERLQKILAQAGVASRRHAEELITQGRVQVNGKIVTELGSKADRNRDHIRVDGKLLHGAERLRYFMLNKPRGYVTTVSDPEGRPTVMEFFKKMGERLYPVGRLDYLSEGLLLVTNDGELANKLTRASSGVEKTYLVKVSGVPTEEQIESLREGVSIDRGKPGEGRVRTAAARIRQVRIGENPWYEVVLIEGRNRELRKMFEEIGHFVEKIRRVGYGPLVLDQEPGNLRELDPDELNLLRLAAEGKWKPKRIKSTAMLPKAAGRTVAPEAGKRRPGKPFRPVQSRPEERRPPESRPEGRGGGQDRGRAPSPGRPPFQDRGFAPRSDDRGSDRGPRRDTGRSFGRPTAGGDRRTFTKPPADRGEGRAFSKPPINRGESRGFAKPPVDRGGDRRSFSRPPAEGSGQRPFRGRPAAGGRGAGETDKPRTNPRFDRPAFPSRPRRPEGGAGFEERKPFRPRTDRPVRAPGDKSRWVPRPGKPAGGSFGGDRARPASGPGRSFGPGSDTRGAGRTGAPPRRDAGSGPRGTARPSPGGGAGSFSPARPRIDSGSRPPAGGQGRTGFQGRGSSGGARPAGGARPSGGARPGGGRPSGGSRPSSNGSSRPGFKSKPGGRGPNRGGSSGRKRT